MNKPIKPGDEYNIKVFGVNFSTFIDSEGVQRFRTNGVIRFLLDSKRVDLNVLATQVKRGYFNQTDFIEFWIMSGGTVKQLLEMFPDAPIINSIDPPPEVKKGKEKKGEPTDGETFTVDSEEESE